MCDFPRLWIRNFKHKVSTLKNTKLDLKDGYVDVEILLHQKRCRVGCDSLRVDDPYSMCQMPQILQEWVKSIQCPSLPVFSSFSALCEDPNVAKHLKI